MSEAKICPSCGAPLEAGASKCIYCGVVVKRGNAAVVSNVVYGNSPLQVVDLSDVQQYESISLLADKLWEDSASVQFCGITCGDVHFAQIAWAFESYPTVHLYLLDKELREKFMQLEVCSYFRCGDPVNLPSNYVSVIELFPDTIAAVLTVVAQGLFDASESDLKYDINGEPVTVGPDGEITFINSEEVMCDGAETGMKSVLERLRPLLIFWVIAVLFVMIIEC